VSTRRVDRRVDLDGSVVEVVEVDGELHVRRHGPGADPDSVTAFAPIDDPALAGLAQLLDRDRCTTMLERMLEGPVTLRSTTLVRYRAGRRATVRLELDGAAPTVVYAKAFHDGAKAAATAVSVAHLHRQLPSGGPLRLPALLGHDPAAAVIVLAALDGTPASLPAPLGDGAASVAEAREPMAAMGTAMGILHGLDHGPLPDRPTSADLDKTARRVDALAEGALRGRLQHWLADLQHSTPPPPARADLVAVHGDCKPAQFLLGSYVALLDPDHLGVGDPAGDVAQFHVSLLQAAVRAGADVVVAHDLIDAFDAGYSSVRAVDAARVRWFEQLTLLRKAIRAEARDPGTELAAALAAAAER